MDFEINELCDVYTEMDKAGKREMMRMAEGLLSVQFDGNDRKIFLAGKNSGAEKSGYKDERMV